MTNLLQAICFKDDINVVFEALSEWCDLRKKSPNSLEACRAASALFDLFQAGYETKELLLAALERSNSAQHVSAVTYDFTETAGAMAASVHTRE
ncbi:hypothetical protein [Rhizobium sp. BK251]|uniref:hypothetical protein n=1 Tax=Rhizobium sp. BK251 TaxID=2512125 RepID=UPI001053087D|nr:hypothetical protein [Rhizobium sp. BK251]TCL72649.1 hypothetical protein EV286_10472 [Rhizobium sp. BK251]